MIRVSTEGSQRYSDHLLSYGDLRLHEVNGRTGSGDLARVKETVVILRGEILGKTMTMKMEKKPGNKDSGRVVGVHLRLS